MSDERQPQQNAFSLDGFLSRHATLLIFGAGLIYAVGNFTPGEIKVQLKDVQERVARLEKESSSNARVADERASRQEERINDLKETLKGLSTQLSQITLEMNSMRLSQQSMAEWIREQKDEDRRLARTASK